MLVHPKGCPQSFFTTFPQRVAVRYQYNWLLRDVVEQSSSFSKRDVSDHFRSKIRCICDKHQTTSPPNEITRSELNFCQCISSILQHYTLKLSQTSTFSLVPVLWNDCERDRGPPGDGNKRDPGNTFVPNDWHLFMSWLFIVPLHPGASFLCKEPKWKIPDSNHWR